MFAIRVMEILAYTAMGEPESALVVLDPQGDMAPPARPSAARLGARGPTRTFAVRVDFADRQRCARGEPGRTIGLNLLDMTLGLDVDKCGGGSRHPADACDPRDLIGLGEALCLS